MKKSSILFLIISILFFFSCNKDGTDPQPPDNNEPPADTVPDVLPDSVWRGKTIQELQRRAFPEGNVFFGVASHESLIGKPSCDTAVKEFDYLTPANDFKQSYMHPKPDVYQFEKSDKWINYSNDSNFLLRLHSPISPQCSQWVKEDNRTPEELETMLNEYLDTLCAVYCNNPNVIWMDVVNETIDKVTGDWFGPKPGTDKWENPWTIIGYDSSDVNFIVPKYIEMAFAITNEKAPTVKQIINQHGELESYVWDKMKQLTQYLRNKGYRVDGLGWQAHIELGWEKEEGNLQRLDSIVKWCHQNNLEFHITEFNVYLKDGNELEYDKQAETFAAITKVLLENHETGTVGINYWHVKPDDTSKPEWDGTMWQNSLEPKPAYWDIKQLIAGYIDRNRRY
jgi:GH35 family endo-1,4-beta-xylanase